MDTNSYVAFLLIGTLLVIADGQVIYRNGRQFLRQTAPGSPAESTTRLVSVLFHILVLGVLALISTIDVPADNPTEAVVLRLGIVLIVIGIAHWAAVVALSRIRDREEFDEVVQEREARRIANEMANGTYQTHVDVGERTYIDSPTVNRQQRRPVNPRLDPEI